MSWRRFEAALVALVLTAAAAAQELTDLKVGHWVVVRGALEGDDRFVASELEWAAPEEEEHLIGTIQAAAEDRSWFQVLGMRVTADEGTRWRIDDGALVGQRVKVEGHHRGPRKFSASTVSRRGPGRDRLAGRVDAVRADGRELELMRWLVRVPADAEVTREGELSTYPLIDPRGLPRAADRSGSLRAGRDDDDDIPVSVQLSEQLALGLRLDLERTDEREFDLDRSDEEDRVDDEGSLRLELLWTPQDNFHALVGLRHRWRWRDDDEDGASRLDRGTVAEMYGYWKDIGGLPLDLQLGRQDFDEPREWLWDENLDAVRLIAYPGEGLRLELAAATTLRDGNPRQENTESYLAHLTWGDDDRSVGAYLFDSRADLDVDDYPFHYGVRALGDWFPDHEVWLELAAVSGYEGDQDLRGYGFDLGTTWSPDALDPWSLTVGYAFGTGDDDPLDGVDRSFRQTGLQDNNDKFGGVTSFKYYGELLQPELSNLGILTLGVGRRFGRRHSLDLVYHAYQQDEPNDRLRSADLDRRPDGVHRSIGSEWDLVLGSRLSESIHLECVLATFQPGAAFPSDAEDAFLGRLQLRLRF